MKISKLLLASSLVFILTACGNNNSENKTNETNKINNSNQEISTNQKENEEMEEVDISALDFNLIENDLRITNTTQNQSFTGFIYIDYKDISNKKIGWDTVYLDEPLNPQASTTIILNLPTDFDHIDYSGSGKWENKKISDNVITIPFETIYESNNGPVKSLYLKLVPYSDETAKQLYDQLVEKYKDAGVNVLNVSIFDETYDEPMGKSPKDSFEKFYDSHSYN